MIMSRLDLMDTEYRQANTPDLELLVICIRNCQGSHTWRIYDEAQKQEFLKYWAARDPARPICCWSAEAESRSLDSLGIDIRKLQWFDGMVGYKLLHNGDPSYAHHWGMVEACRRLGISYMIDKVFYVGSILDGSWTQHKEAIDKYCMSDVDALWSIMEILLPQFESAGIPDNAILYHSKWPAYLALVAKTGIPIDHDRLMDLCRNSRWLRSQIIYKSNIDIFPFYVCDEGVWHFRYSRFVRYLGLKNLIGIWPKTESGKYATDTDSVEYYGDESLQNFLTVRKQITQLRWFEDEPNSDWQQHYTPGTLRPYFNPNGTVTGRNAPPSRQFLPAMSSWLRSLIRAPEGKVIVGVDWGSQEYAIAAGLSQDRKMIEAYNSGDPYYWWAQAVGAVPALLPEGKTKADYKPIRNLFKAIVLGLQYTMGAPSLARHISMETGVACTVTQARKYITSHRSTYAQYWNLLWSSGRRIKEFPNVPIVLSDGWRIIPKDVRQTTMGNFPVQGTAAVILKLAVMKALEEGLEVIFPLHDAIYLLCSESEASSKKELLMDIMSRAARKVMPSINIRMDATEYRRENWWVEDKGEAYFAFFAPFLGWKYTKVADSKKTHYGRSD